MNTRALPVFAARDRDGKSKSASICMVAEDILQELPGRAAHIDDIARIAMERNRNLDMALEAFKAAVSRTLAAEIKKKRGSLFQRVTHKRGGKTVNKSGWYKLRSVVGTAVSVIPPAQTDSLYFGKYGEYAVISELLYRGFNVSPMIVDRGIDLVAEKGGQYFYIQVKASLEVDASWKFAVKRASFDANHSGKMHYIFVLRSATEIKSTFFVVPSTHIDTLIKGHSIKGDASALSIKIASTDKGKSWRLNNTECAMFLNAFNQLV